TADGEVCVGGECREHGEQPPGGRVAHVLAISPAERGPPLRGKGGGHDPAHKRLARGQFWQRDVEEVSHGVLVLAHAARRPAHGADAQAFATLPRRPESHDPDGHLWSLPELSGRGELSRNGRSCALVPARGAGPPPLPSLLLRAGYL